MLLIILTVALAIGPLQAADFSRRDQALAWLATHGLRPGDEIPSFSQDGPFTFRDADVDQMTFTYPPRGVMPESALRKLAHDLRDQGFTSLRRVVIYSGGLIRVLYDIYDLKLEHSYRVTNRSLSDLRNRSYLRGEMSEDTLTRLGGRILDFGCGSRARTILALREAGFEAYGVDPGAEPCVRGDIVRAEPGAATSFTNESMRRIFSSYSVFLYSENDPAELRANLAECDRLLEPGGDLVLAGVTASDRLRELVNERPNLNWVESYRNGEIFGPTVIVRKR